MIQVPILKTYSASDYAGLETKNFKAYYGYEEVDENEEWCFVARFEGKVIKISNSTLPVKDKFDCNECLLVGIGMILSEYKLVK